ncbi:hypothetical protein AFLA70_289g001671 [Aspergillus flavus AF70]|nr:hypothetical protein AFLA70_289g001671 [Aspergillus flavus AF70]
MIDLSFGKSSNMLVNGKESYVLETIRTDMACIPSITRELQSRLDALPDLESDWLAQIDLLDAILNETMRLYSPNPSGLQRVTPAEGLQIGDKFIPGNVVVQVQMYTVYRDNRVFEHPDEFIPER